MANSATAPEKLKHRSSQSLLTNLMELLGSMRFAISLLTLICIASAIGTMVRQNEPWVNYVNQFGPFWAGFFGDLGLFRIYNAPWFIGIMAFLVTSTSLCVWRNAPKMIREMRVFRENLRENSLLAFSHRWQGRFAQSASELPGTITEWLKYKGYRVRLSKRDGGTMIAAKAGSGNRLGYIATHLAIIVICVGGLLDSGVPLKIAIWAMNKHPVKGGFISNQIPEDSRLGVHNPSYRANLLLPEGQSSRVAVLNTDNGLLIQDLPFTLTLKHFRIAFYSTGMPKLFASDVQVYDPATKKRFDATIEVNKPLVYKGVTIYQSSFDDGGSKVTLKAIPLTGDLNKTFEVKGEIGTNQALKQFGGRYTLELAGFKSINVESMPVNNQADDEQSSGDQLAKKGLETGPEQASNLDSFKGNLASVIGPGIKHNQKNRFTNIGPSVTYKLRDKSGQAKEFKTYMLPVTIDGEQYYLAGMRDTPADDFQYMRMPVDENGQINGFMRLRAALQNPALREKAAERFATIAFSGQGDSAALRNRVQESARKALDRFAGADGGPGGLSSIANFIEKTIPENEREKAGSVIIRILQGSMWQLYQISREQAGLPDAPTDEKHGRFVQEAQLGLSDIGFFGAPVLFQMEQFDEIKASVFQVAKAPGQWVVYAGCLLLVLGVFSMFYIRERRLFFWVTPEKDGSKVWMGMSTTRKTLDFEKEFQDVVKTLDERASGPLDEKDGDKA